MGPRLKLTPEEYDRIRARVLRRDGWRCQECGSSQQLQIHHITKRSNFGDDTEVNLITLCVICHYRKQMAGFFS
jgi:5-methylcytosine-specific restriction endonuclease McrA